MGDSHVLSTGRRPGVAIVRPKLHENIQKNRDLFKRWTKLHMRDTLSLLKDKNLGGASRVLRYIRTNGVGEEEYFYTIVLDDTRLPGTEAFQKVSQRLDLENTRSLHSGEEAVLLPGDPRKGTEPMVSSIVAPTACIFEEMRSADLEPTGNEVWRAYQSLPVDLATPENAPKCTLVTLTIAPAGSARTSFRHVRKLQSSLVSFLATATRKLQYTSVYHHDPVMQPHGLPEIAESQDGNGEWVVCVFVGGDADKELLEAGWEGVEGQVDEWRKRLKIEGSLEGLDMKVGVWKGDVFMS